MRRISGIGRWRVGPRDPVWGTVIAVVAASFDTAAIVALNHAVRIPNVSLLYLPAILLVAVYFGTRPSLLAAIVAVLQYDFFLLRPLYTFTIAQAQDALAIGVFCIVAILTGQLAAGARERAEAAQRRAAESTMLFELGQALMSARDLPDILQTMTERIFRDFGVDRCAIFVPRENGELRLAAETPAGSTRVRAESATASWVFRTGEQVWLPAGEDAERSRRQAYIPLRAANSTVGVMEIGRKLGDDLDPPEVRLLTSFAAQAALLIARTRAEAEQRRLAVVEESDRLKSALLAAVSHDLRTPLASIKASATVLLLRDSSWSEAEGREFLEAIDREADRLNRLVGNLLDLSRMEAGVLRPALDWYDVREVVAAIEARLLPSRLDRSVDITIEGAIPPVRLDLLRIEELVVNLVENAARFAPDGTAIEFRVWQRDGLYISVADHGPGVPDELRRRIFETFYQGRPTGDRMPGTGLGLAICRGVAEAHGGAIEITETPGGGATFTLRLPASSLDQRVKA